MTEKRQSRFQDTIRSLKHRNFQLFFSGQMISLVGTWMDTVAEAWLVYRLTGSSLLLGTVTFAGQIPVFFLAPLSGMVADRFNRRKIVIATQASSMVIAFILAMLTLTKHVTVMQVIVLAALMGVVNAFDIPARQSFLVEMVGREDMMNAIALNSSMFNGARIIGPAIAGILVASFGEGWCFFANSVSYIAVIAGLLLMRIPPKVPTVVASPLEHIAEGFRFVRDTAPIRALLLLIALVSLVAMPYSVLMPVFAAKILHGNARTLGTLMGATGVGAMCGALLIASRRGVGGLGRWVFMACARSAPR
jgi:MFS family permease